MGSKVEAPELCPPANFRELFQDERKFLTGLKLCLRRGGSFGDSFVGDASLAMVGRVKEDALELVASVSRRGNAVRDAIEGPLEWPLAKLANVLSSSRPMYSSPAVSSSSITMNFSVSCELWAFLSSRLSMRPDKNLFALDGVWSLAGLVFLGYVRFVV